MNTLKRIIPILSQVLIIFAVLVLLIPSAQAQRLTSKVQLVSVGGVGSSFSLAGRYLVLRPGDSIPIGSTIRTSESSTIVLSPSPGVLVVAEHSSQLQITRNELTLNSIDPSVQVGLNLIAGRVSINTSTSLSVSSRIVVNTVQSQYIMNNASCTITSSGFSSYSSSFVSVSSSTQVTGGIGVTTGKVTSILSTSEQITIRSGYYMAMCGTGSQLIHYMRQGALPAVLASFNPGEIPTLDEDLISMTGGRINSFADSFLYASTTREVEVDLRKLLYYSSSTDVVLASGIPYALNGGGIPASVENSFLHAFDFSLTDLTSSTSTTKTKTDLPTPIFKPIDVVQPIQIISSASATGTRLSAFNFRIQTNTTTGATISVNNLPPGLTLNGDTISGTPTTTGTTGLTVTATDSTGTTTQTLTITISKASDPTLVISPAPGLIYTGFSYSYSVTASAPAGATLTTITYTGSLPPGLTFNGSTITGRPTTNGTGTTSYTAIFSVSTEDGSGSTTSVFSVTVQQTPPQDNSSISYISLSTNTTQTETSSAFSTKSSIIPGVYWGTAGDNTVISSGGGLYWPWADNQGNPTAVGSALLAAGFGPDGDVYAAYYVYRNYDSSGNISTGGGYVTLGTYPPPFIY